MIARQNVQQLKDERAKSLVRHSDHKDSVNNARYRRQQAHNNEEPRPGHNVRFRDAIVIIMRTRVVVHIVSPRALAEINKKSLNLHARAKREIKERSF
jgi:hypothetical protein